MKTLLGLLLPCLAALSWPALAETGQSVPNFSCYNEEYRTSKLIVDGDNLTLTESYFDGLEDLKLLAQNAGVETKDVYLTFATLVIPLKDLNCLNGPSFELACGGESQHATLNLKMYADSVNNVIHASYPVIVRNLSLNSILRAEDTDLSSQTLIENVSVQVRHESDLATLHWNTRFVPTELGSIGCSELPAK